MSLHINGDISISYTDLHYLCRDLVDIYEAMESACLFSKEQLQIVETAIKLAGDIEAYAETDGTDWEKYMDYYEEEDLEPEIRRKLSELRDIIGDKTQITVGNNQNKDNGYVTFVNGNLYSNFLTYKEAESEIRDILTGIKLGEKK